MREWKHSNSFSRFLAKISLFSVAVTISTMTTLISLQPGQIWHQLLHPFSPLQVGRWSFATFIYKAGCDVDFASKLPPINWNDLVWGNVYMATRKKCPKPCLPIVGKSFVDNNCSSANVKAILFWQDLMTLVIVIILIKTTITTTTEKTVTICLHS